MVSFLNSIDDEKKAVMKMEIRYKKAESESRERVKGNPDVIAVNDTQNVAQAAGAGNEPGWHSETEKASKDTADPAE